MFVTAIDRRDAIFFFACVSFEERDPGSDLGGGESCYLRAGLWEQQVKQVIFKTELPNSLCPCTFFPHEFGNLFGTPVIRKKWKLCLVGREGTWCRSRPHPLENKALASKQSVLMKLHLITWLKGVLLIWEAALQNPVPCSASQQGKQEGERKPHLQDPPTPHTPSWRGWSSSKANTNTELTSGTAAKNDNLLPFLMIEFVICTLANWELEWDQWVILHRSLYSGPEWNCWPRGESL